MNEKKILVIDDEWAIRYLLEGQLRRAGYTVYAVPDGPGGLALMATYAPDLVILDIMMPEMDGFEVCRRIRCHPQAADTPIMFLSGSTTKDYKRLAFELGADDFLVKPFQTEELLARIETVFRRHGQTGERIADESKEGEEANAAGRIVGLIGAAPGVGTTTLAIQLSETIALHSNWPVLLVDLDLSGGRIATQLKLFHAPHILDLLRSAEVESETVALVQQHAQPHQAGLHVIPAPAQPQKAEQSCSLQLVHLLETLSSAGSYVVLDLGATLNELTVAALRQADLAYVVTPGQLADGNRFNEFADRLVELGVHASHVVAVVGEVGERCSHRENGQSASNCLPFVSEKARNRFWSADNRLRQLIGVMA